MNRHEQDTTSSRYAVFAAKVQAPRLRSDLVIRARLYTQLQPLLQARLGLVSAPAGFGKTTLISAAIQHFGWQAAWVSLDASDNNPLRFWICLFYAFRAVYPDLPSPPADISYTDFSRHFDRWLAWLLAGLRAVSTGCLLVLDDYHVIDTPAIHDGLKRLLDHLPSYLHLVLITRCDPPFPLARMRVNRELVEVRTDDLRFRSDEAKCFMRGVENLTLSEMDMRLLEQRTEGWAAGLQIAALCLRDTRLGRERVRRFTGANTYLADYLTEEVLQALPEAVYTFLLDTSLLGSLTADLCDAVTGRSDGRAMLDYLERVNLFLTPLDDHRQWYRYHTLFADFLFQRLQRADAGRAAQLHRRACDWYVQNALYEPAIIHALAVPDYTYASDLLTEAALPLLFRGDIPTLLHWLSLLPAEEIQARPSLELLSAWMRLVTGELDEVEQALHRFEASGTDVQSLAPFKSQIYSIRSEVAHLCGDVPGALALARKAVGLLSNEHALMRGIITINLGYVQWSSGDLDGASHTLRNVREGAAQDPPPLIDLLTLYNLARLQALRGELDAAEATYQEALHRIGDPTGQFEAVVGLIEVGLAELDYLWNRIEAAADHARRGIALGRSCLYVKSLLTGYFTLALSQHALHQPQAAAETLREVEHLIRRARLTPLLRHLQALQARLWLAEGSLAAAGEWAKKSHLDGAARAAYWNEFEYLTLTQVRIAQGRASEILPLLEHLSVQAEQQNRVTSLIEILLLRALAHGTRRETSAAQRTLNRALALAEPQGYERLFVDKGGAVASLMQQMADRTPYTMSLLNAFADVRARYGTALTAALNGKVVDSSILFEPLSGRELEVLVLMAEGLSNQQNAQHLVISTGTVKTHVKSIFRKLQVSNRTQAVPQARRFHLFSSD